MSSYKLPVSSWSSTLRHTHFCIHTHTHTYTLVCVHIYCMFTGKFKKCNTPKLGSLSSLIPAPFLSLSLSFPLTLVSCHRSTATAMAFLCKTTVCCQQHNGTRNTLSQCRQAGRQEGGRAGPNFPGSSWQLKQRRSGEKGGRMKDNGQLGARYFPLISACSNGPLKWL